MGKFKWKKLSAEKKYELVHQIVSDPAQYKERLEASNFHKLLKVLQCFLGGKETQEKLIEKQLDVAVSKMSIGNDEGQLFTDQLIAVFDRSKALGKDTSSLAPKFWALYKDLKAHVISNLKSNPMQVDALDAPMKELIKYSTELQNKLIQCHPSIAEDENKGEITQAMKELINHQIAVVVENANGWKPMDIVATRDSCCSYPQSWTWHGNGRWRNVNTNQYHYSTQDEHPEERYESAWVYNDAAKTWKNRYSNKEVGGAENENPASKPVPLSSWTGMSPKDWTTIVGSILLLSRHKAFYEAFGQDIIDLEWMARYANFSKPLDFCFTCKNNKCTSSSHCKPLSTYYNFEKGQYDADGVFLPEDKTKYNRAVQIKVPDSPSDPSHWGHLAWLFCEYMESVEA